MKLNQLRDNPGATHSIKRVGRGYGSGLGKTSGSGQKGQKSRSGVAIKGFEGGQMPIYIRLPKRGFRHLKEKTTLVNLGMIERAIEAGRLDSKIAITSETLVQAGLARKAEYPVRLLAKGKIKTAIQISVDHASAVALEAVKKTGGKVSVTPKLVKEETKKTKTKGK